MRTLLLFLLITLPLRGAILRGYAVEHSTGKALARTRVAIEPLPGTSGATLSVFTNSSGIFEFLNLPAGAYLVNAARRGFAPVHYGQKRWNAPGTPVVLEQDQAVAISIRLPRYGGITGYVVDENDVGMSEHEVLAYRNTRPPKVVAKFPTDDRGWFRIWGLDPGTYLVRTAGRKYEDGDYLPTFFRETLRVEEAAQVQVALDQDTPDVRVRPFPGKLLNISGRVLTCYPGQTATLTLVSDMGRETITTGESFNFYGKPPGNYEIYAETPGDARTAPCGAYVPFALENRDYSDLRVPLVRRADINISFDGITGIDPNRLPIQYRRKDLAGESEPQSVRLLNGSMPLNPGRWEFRLLPSSAYVAIDFHGLRGEQPENRRADGWVEVVVRGPGLVRWTLSDKPGAIHGVVTGAAHDIVPGAPVLIEAWDPVANRRVLDLRTVRADMQGRFQIYGLAPGMWRVLSTLDLESPDSFEIDTLSPRTLKVEVGRDHQLDLDLSVLR
ncbi:MAG TPA: carboxypeptidase-like regulatory domain-containing protein [Candidatus Acidoferrum sp.]|nr:carboxypeptidase-like regulatory domain-containing protein [Candidatus Acidoferrum sp.]